MVKVVKIRATEEPEWLVCEAARGDYMKVPHWTVSREEMMKGIKGDTLEDKKAFLIKRLINAGHWGPWEHAVITFGIEGMSRVTMAQLTRHRLASFDIQSARFVKMESDSLVIPDSFNSSWIKSREGFKEINLDDTIRKEIDKHFSESRRLYNKLTESGIPKEDARYLLTLATPVNGTMTVNARSLMHIIALRSFGDSQWEIRDLVGQMLDIAKEWMPVTFKLFEERMKNRNIIAP